MYVINSVDNAELPCYTLPPTSTTLSLESYPFFQPPSRYNCGDLIHSGIPVVEVN